MVQTSLIILTRNEIVGLKALIRKIPFEAVDEYFAVDFESTDGTVELFVRLGIPVVKQQKAGRAQGFYEGFERARGKFLIFFSPDGNEDPSDIPELIAKFKQGFDLVIASRFMKNARNEEDDKRFKFRKWANQGFTTIAKLIWGGRLTDTINGYRAITKSAFKSLYLDAQGYAIEYQMTIRALKLGLKIAEIPTIEGNRISGKSGSEAIPTGIRFIYYLVREIILGTSFCASSHSSLKNEK